MILLLSKLPRGCQLTYAGSFLNTSTRNDRCYKSLMPGSKKNRFKKATECNENTFMVSLAIVILLAVFPQSLRSCLVFIAPKKKTHLLNLSRVNDNGNPEFLPRVIMVRLTIGSLSHPCVSMQSLDPFSILRSLQKDNVFDSSYSTRLPLQNNI